MKKKITVITILLFVAVMCCVLTACADPHEHELQHFEAKEPTCTERGNIEYWYCADCGKYFSDETAGTEITKDKTVLVATGKHDWSEWVTDSESSCTIGGMRHRVCNDCGERQEEALPIGEHNMTHVAAVSATCIDEGNVEYWHCKECGKNFADENAEELLTDISLPLGAHNIVDGKCMVCGKSEEQIVSECTHKLTHVDEIPSTCIRTGTREHWHCEMCGKNFADQNAEEILADLSLPLGAHNFVDDKCMVCGIDEIFIKGTPGLQYTLIVGGNAYMAAGCGTATDTDIVIASEYNGLPVTSIGSGAFSGCSGLTSITIPDSVTSIGQSAFNGCSGLTSITIPDSVTSIGQSAFRNCSSLTSITIPDSVTSIGESAFSGCSSLESITIPFVGGSVKTASDTYQYPFGYIFGTSSYSGGVRTYQVYPGSISSSTTSSYYYIPASLKSVTVTGGNILYGAFYNCSGLTSITIPNSVTSIGQSAFRNCSGLTSITIPDGVTSIGDYAFYNCSGLTSITIPDGVISIGMEAFYGCRGLTSITIPDSVTSISSGAFAYCDLLTNITVEEGNAVYHSEGNCIIKTDSKRLIVGCKKSVIPSDGSVTSIGESAFEGCSSLKRITIPKGITMIDWGAFKGCSSIEGITIPNSVTRIESEAFAYCTRLGAIRFQGTIAQWRKISKGLRWGSHTRLHEINCVDGATAAR